MRIVKEWFLRSGGAALPFEFYTAPVIGSAINLSNLNKVKTSEYVVDKLFENNALKRILVNRSYIEKVRDAIEVANSAIINETESQTKKVVEITLKNN